MVSKYARLLVLTSVFLTGALAEVSLAVPEGISGSFDFGFVHNNNTVTLPAEAWVPTMLDRVRGMLFLCPGRGGDSRYWMNNWKNAAGSIGFGIVGWRDSAGWPADYSGGNSIESSTNIQGLLDNVASLSGRPEISNTPVAYYGFSKGGWVANWFAANVPSRSLGFFSDKSSTWVSSLSQQAKQVPGMFVIGSADTLILENWGMGGFNTWRINQQANVALTVNWGSGHSLAPADLMQSFLAEAIKERYPQGQLPSLDPGNPLSLNSVDPAGTYLSRASSLDNNQMVEIANKLVAPSNEYTGNADIASWSPNRTSALVNNAHKFTEGPNPLSVWIDGPNSIDLGESITLHVSLASGFATPDINSIKLYHDDEEIDITASILDDGSHTVTYTPQEFGIHSFVAAVERVENELNNIYSNYDVVFVQPIPEPATLGLLLVGGLVLLRNRSRTLS